MDNQNSIYDEVRDMDTLGGRIGRAREASGRSQDEMARKLGVTKDTWTKWEADREEPRANRLALLAGFLNVSPSWLLYGAGKAPGEEDHSEVMARLLEKLASVERAHSETTEAIASLKRAIQTLPQKDIEADA